MSLVAILCKKQNELKKQMKDKKMSDSDKKELQKSVSEIQTLLINRYKSKYHE